MAARTHFLLDMSQTQARLIHDIELPLLNGEPASLSAYAGKIVLAVNVASRCGYTPQYGGLQALHDRYSPKGFTVLGFPCNQFFKQEPGSAEEIQSFCSINYGVTFPLFAKLDVKGAHQHPLYAILSDFPDDAGKAGNVTWNFEKFLVDKDGHVARRFRPKVVPDDPTVVEAIESLL